MVESSSWLHQHPEELKRVWATVDAYGSQDFEQFFDALELPGELDSFLEAGLRQQFLKNDLKRVQQTIEESRMSPEDARLLAMLRESATDGLLSLGSTAVGSRWFQKSSTSVAQRG